MSKAATLKLTPEVTFKAQPRRLSPSPKIILNTPVDACCKSNETNQTKPGVKALSLSLSLKRACKEIQKRGNVRLCVCVYVCVCQLTLAL